MKRINIFVQEKVRKVAWHGSVVFMIVAWLFLAALLTWVVLKAWLESYFSEWSFGAYFFLAVYLFVLVMIPVQLVRYFREKRRETR